MNDERTLPKVIEARTACESDDLIRWANDHLDYVHRMVCNYGAVLLRGFSVTGPDMFRQFANIFCPVPSQYIGGNSPRTHISDGVFTSTEYSNREKITAHHEASYTPWMPRFIVFYCDTPATINGRTPLVDSRRVFSGIPESVRQEFAIKRVKYVANLHNGRKRGLGRSWTEVFQACDKSEVERTLRAAGYEYDWKPCGGLRTSLVADAVVQHPLTAELVWINQAHRWHPSSLPPPVREVLSRSCPQIDFPRYATFGDDSELNENDLATIRRIIDDEQMYFDWAARDILLCDNLLVMHGREPFEGPRKILVSMG